MRGARPKVHLADPLIGGRVGSRDRAEKDDGWRPLVDILEQVQVAQDEGRALQNGDGKAQLQADLQYAPRDLELDLAAW